MRYSVIELELDKLDRELFKLIEVFHKDGLEFGWISSQQIRKA